MRDGDVENSKTEWICAGGHCWRAGRFAPILQNPLHSLVSTRRISSDVWTRYRLGLDDLPAPADEPEVHRIDTTLFEFLSRHRECDANQLQSALRFWRLRFGEGYLWMENGEPLCLQWLITADHYSARSGLGHWAGMYPPMGKNVGVVESIYTFRKGLRRRGGVATLMARAVLRHSLNKGLSELRTQVHRDNTAAHRWAARLGWQPIGEVIRLSVDLRGLRGHYLYLHTRALSPQSSPSIVERGYEQNIAPPTHAPSPSVSLDHNPQQGVVGQS